MTLYYFYKLCYSRLMVSLYFWDPVSSFCFELMATLRLSIHVLLIPLSKWQLHLSIDHVYSKWQMKPNFKWRGEGNGVYCCVLQSYPRIWGPCTVATILSPIIIKGNIHLHSFYIKLCNRNIEPLTSSLFSSYVVIYYFYL